MKLNNGENILFESHLDWLSRGFVGMNLRNFSRIYLTNQRIYFELSFPKFRILEIPVKQYEHFEEFSSVVGKGIRIFYRNDESEIKKVGMNIKKEKAETLKGLLNNL